MNSPLTPQKSLLRTQIKETLHNIPEPELKLLSERICSKLMENKLLLSASTLLFYMPLKTETDIIPVIKEMMKQKKECYVPRVQNDDSCKMDFFKLCNDKPLETQLIKGAYGILEPADDLPLLSIITKPAVMLVPGVAFDENKNRLGKGKGFYDRYLDKIDFEITKIGICFDFQLLKNIPADTNDFKMDIIISDKRTIG